MLARIVGFIVEWKAAIVIGAAAVMRVAEMVLGTTQNARVLLILQTLFTNA